MPKKRKSTTLIEKKKPAKKMKLAKPKFESEGSLQYGLRLTAKHGEKILGSIDLHRMPDGTWLSGFFMREDLIQAGHGKQLINRAIQIGRRAKAKRLKVRATSPAEIEILRSLGFKYSESGNFLQRDLTKTRKVSKIQTKTRGKKTRKGERTKFLLKTVRRLSGKRTKFLAEVDGKNAGQLVIKRNARQPDKADLSALGVPEEFEGRGIASGLIKKALHFCGKSGIRTLEVMPTGASRKLYRSFGFRETGNQGAMALNVKKYFGRVMTKQMQKKETKTTGTAR